MQKFVDDVIDHKEDDIEKIQTKPNMYISYLGKKGVLHLAKETINNMIDEAVNPNSPCDDIMIIIDEIENTIAIMDNGRGIPFEKLEVICTKLQAGSKFTREGGGGTAGENGVGLTAVNALSDEFEIVSRRYGEKAIIGFQRGKKTQPLKVTKTAKKDVHGTTFKFKPSPFFMGEDCEISSEGVMDWLERIIYLVPHNVKITLTINRKGKESNVTKKYKNKKGLYDLIKKLTEKPILDPIHFMTSKNLKEFDKGKELDRTLGLEVAFTFNSSPSELTVESYCNFVSTVDHGVHVDGPRQGIVQYLSKKARESLSERESKKYDITFNDVTSGLVLTVYLSTNMNPHFSSQTKEKTENSALYSPLRAMTYNWLEEHFKKNPKELKKITDYIKMNAKARHEATKARNSIIKNKANANITQHSMKMFDPAIARGKKEYRELFLVEGESAAGSANQGKFNYFQATFGVKGVPLNSFTRGLADINNNEELKALVLALRCGIGPTFNIDDLWYDKIIIMTDSDVDGFNISSLLCAFFIKHMPQLVEAGKIYKAVAPLYSIDDKKNPFVRNKKEFIKVYERRIGDKIRLVDPENGAIMKSKDFQEFLLVNRTYLDELMHIANYYGVSRDIIEFVAIHHRDKDFKKQLANRFPELTLDSDGMLTGVHEGRYQIIALDKLFFKRIETLLGLIFKYNKGVAYHRILEKETKEYADRGVMTIGELMAHCVKHRPKIKHRFKGLGEINPEDLRETTLDPKNRILIRLTVDDMKKEIETFNVLHGSAREERKELMAHFKINREDLDN